MSEASPSIGNHPCQATRKDAQPCTVRAITGSAWCFAHDPARAADRDEARCKGGRGKGRSERLGKLVPASVRPSLSLLFTALDEVHRGDLDPRAAGAMAALAGAITRLYQTGVLEERLAALEQAQAQAQAQARTTGRHWR